MIRSLHEQYEEYASKMNGVTPEMRAVMLKVFVDGMATAGAMVLKVDDQPQAVRDVMKTMMVLEILSLSRRVEAETKVMVDQFFTRKRDEELASTAAARAALDKASKG